MPLKTSKPLSPLPYDGLPGFMSGSSSTLTTFPVFVSSRYMTPAPESLTRSQCPFRVLYTHASANSVTDPFIVHQLIMPQCLGLSRSARPTVAKRGPLGLKGRNYFSSCHRSHHLSTSDGDSEPFESDSLLEDCINLQISQNHPWIFCSFHSCHH